MKGKFLALTGTAFIVALTGGLVVAQQNSPTSPKTPQPGDPRNPTPEEIRELEAAKPSAEIKLSPQAQEILCKRFPQNSRCGGQGAVPSPEATSSPQATPSPESTTTPETTPSPESTTTPETTPSPESTAPAPDGSRQITPNPGTPDSTITPTPGKTTEPTPGSQSNLAPAPGYSSTIKVSPARSNIPRKTK